MKKLLKQLIYNYFSLGLDRKISVRATRDELIERGILLPDVASVGNSNSVSANMQLHNSRLPQHSNNFSNIENTVKGRKDIYKSKTINKTTQNNPPAYLRHKSSSISKLLTW